jgi:hypothetical protein
MNVSLALWGVDGRFSKHVEKARLLWILKFIKLNLPVARLFIVTNMSFENDEERDSEVRSSDDAAFIVRDVV